MIQEVIKLGKGAAQFLWERRRALGNPRGERLKSNAAAVQSVFELIKQIRNDGMQQVERLAAFLKDLGYDEEEIKARVEFELEVLESEVETARRMLSKGQAWLEFRGDPETGAPHVATIANDQSSDRVADD